MHHALYPAVAALALLFVTGQRAGADEMKMVLVPDDSAVQWQPGPANLPKGSQLAVLAGDPGKPGPFALRVKIPANTIIAPHRHATDENLTVISGDLYHGMGEKADKSQGHLVKQGGFVYLPAQMPHYVWTNGQDSVVQVTGTGPFGLIYVNPEDDPSKRH